jgi:hypothetical protein
MDEITGALVGIALVLSAVFLPMAFFGGSGVIYRQFSITIVSAMMPLGARGDGSRRRCAPPCSSPMRPAISFARFLPLVQHPL